jgi:hypothetical protein
MYNKIKQNIKHLSDDEILDLLLHVSKVSADRNPIKLKEVIVAALKNGILEAGSPKSLGYENMALSYGLAFMEVQDQVTEMKEEDKAYGKVLREEIEEAVNFMMEQTDEEVYH